MVKERDSRFINSGFDEESIDPEILPAVKILRDSGIETIASHAGIDEVNILDAWGSYIQIWLHEEVDVVLKKIGTFAQSTTGELRQILGNSTITMQLVSAEQWLRDRNTTTLKSNIPIYRLQLVGHINNEEICKAWELVAKTFTL